MAIYKNLTNEQLSTIEYLFNRAKNVKRRMKSEDNIVEFSHDSLEQELLEIQHQINDVYGARDEYEFHIKRAAEHITEAEELSKKWGF